MRRGPHRSNPRVAGLLATSVVVLAAAFACPGGALAAQRVHSGHTVSARTARAEAAQVARFWTPARMREARPFDLAVGPDGSTQAETAAPPEAAAGASFIRIPTPEAPPFSVEGRVFFRRGEFLGFCSGTAINSPTRALVLTAGHCVNSGREEGKASVWSNHLEFVPAYTGGTAPFGTFVARTNNVYAPKSWTKQGNPDFDMGAFLTLPNSEGINVADAVGGGATIVDNIDRHQTFQTFGYPGEIKFMQGCTSPYIGDDVLSNPLPGPPTMGVHCHWAPGASGGGWLIGEPIPIAGTTGYNVQINGITTYLHLGDKNHTYGPYFSSVNIGKLTAGL
jgi:hypothetical protein